MLRLHSTLVVIVLSFSFQVARAFRFTSGSPTQCDALIVSWTGGTPPFQLLITPVFGVPRNVSIPVDAFNNGRGSFSIPVAYSAGQEFLLTMSDATGFASGGSTDLLVVGPSHGRTCDISSPVGDFEFELNSALQQCRPYTISGYTGAIQPVTFIGIVPRGTAVVLNLPLVSKSFDWNTNVAQGTSMIFLMMDAAGRSGGSSDIKTVGASDDSGCLNNLSPSSTPAVPTSSGISTPVASTTSETSTLSSPTSSSAPKKGTPIGVIVGGVIGALIFLAIAITLALFFLPKKRDSWGAGSSSFRPPRRTQHELDLTYDPEYAPTMYPRSATPMATPTPFVDSNPYVNAPLHRQYPARYRPPSQDLHYPTPSQYQSQPFSSPDTDPFNLDTHSEATPSTRVTQPFVDPLSSRHSMSTAQRKAALAGVSTYTPPSRFIVHTDVEDELSASEDEIVELPPQYSDRRRALPQHGPVMMSNSQHMQLASGSATLFSKS